MATLLPLVFFSNVLLLFAIINGGSPTFTRRYGAFLSSF